MHELGIAQNILEIVQQYVPKEQTAAVRSIRIRVGPLSGIVPDSLEFCFQAIVHETEMQKASLTIDQLPAILNCNKCAYRFETKDLEFLCRSCGSSDLELVSGKELEVVDIEVAEESDPIL
jgi:hydrogenase nickel incorporation protein HypA/HybF